MRSCHSGERWSARRRGSSSARPAASRKRPAKSAVEPELAQHQPHGFGGFDEEPVGIGRLVGVGETENEAVVAPERFDLGSAGGTDAGADGHGPGNMNAAAEGREDADAPVAELVADALDHDGPVVGDLAGGGFLIGEELEQIFGRVGVEVVFGDEAREGGGLGQGAQFANQSADAAAEFERATGAVAFPEGHFARLAGSGNDEHAVVGDVLNAPGGGAEDEGLVGVRLEDHLLVEFADADGLALGVGEEDAIEAAVGNGSGVENGEAGGAVAGGDDVADAVPGEARTEFGKFVGGIAAAEQVEHAFKAGAGEAAEGRGAADEIVEEVDGNFGPSGRRSVGIVVSHPCDRKAASKG